MPSRYLCPIIFILSLSFPLIAGAADNPFVKEIDLFERMEAITMPPSNAALFVGSSSIRLWRTMQRDLSPFPVVNRGFGGSTIADCTFFIPRIVTRYAPAVIFLYAGDNDIAAGNSPEQVLADFRAFVAGCRKSQPAVSIRFISIKPSPARWNLWEKTQKANALVKQYTTGQKGLGYIDVATPMLDQKGTVRGELFLSDRLHMNSEGYRIWTSIIKPIVEESLRGLVAKPQIPQVGGHGNK